MPDSWGIFSKSYSGGHTSLLSPRGGSLCGPGKREKDLQPSLTQLRAKRSRGCRRPALWRLRAAAATLLWGAHIQTAGWRAEALGASVTDREGATGDKGRSSS